MFISEDVVGQFLYLFESKHRTVFADVPAAYIASPAFAHPTTHAAFQRGYNFIGSESKFDKRRHREFKHDWRPAHKHTGIIR
jgi:hypothetical protein